MEICVNGSPLSETQLPYHSDSDEHIVIENICTENNFVQAISIHSFRCETVCEIVTFAHSFCEDFLSTVSKSSKESKKSLGMYGAFNPTGNTHFHSGSVKYYSPTELSKICRQNPDFPSTREGENIDQERLRKHNQEKDADEKLKRKIHKDKKKNTKERKEEISYGPYYMMTNPEDDEKRRKKHKKDRKKEISELNYYDLQCLLNDCNKDTNIATNVRRDRTNEVKRHQRSQSTDQIPTKDVTSEHKLWKKNERPRSAERRGDHSSEKNKDYFMKYCAQSNPNNSFPVYDQSGQHFMAPNQQYPIQHSSRKHREKLKSRKKNLHENEMPEFVTLDQINEQTMNLKDEKFEHHKYNKWETEKNVRHHQQREFYDEYQQQQYRNSLDSQNIDHDSKTHGPSPDEYNKMIQNYYQSMMNKADTSKIKKKERKKDKNKDHKKIDPNKEYKALKKYMKKLAKGQQKDTFYLTTKVNGEIIPSNPDKLDSKGRRYLEENSLRCEPEFDQDDTVGNVDPTKGNKHAKKEFIPLDLGLEELEIPPRHRKNPDHKKHKNKKAITKSESSEKLRSASLSAKNKHRNFNEIFQKNEELVTEDVENVLKKYKSETSLESMTNEKDIVCIYQSKDSPDDKEEINTVKLTKKQEYLSFVADKKHNKKDTSEKQGKERSPYDRNQMVLPTEHKKQMSDILNTQERTLLFQKAMKRDFPTRPRPRLSRSRQRSSRYLAKMEDALHNHSNMKIDEKPTKEVHCYDVGTSTILDNNFGEVLELLKGEPYIKPTGTNKKRSVFHVKKKASREDLVETSRKACDNGEQTLGIVVKGIEPPKKMDTSKVRSRFKFPSEKTKINRLECKMLSVVAINPTKFDDEQADTDQNPIKTQSTPQMQHESISEMRNTSSDKRLERLLKYYKVEAPTKITDQMKTSQKSMKDLIASKLSDYLKKLQDDNNDEMLQIQTDDPKVLKLVLPIEFTSAQNSNNTVAQKNVVGQGDKKPRESFSDLNINYAAENNEEDEDRVLEGRYTDFSTDRPNTENMIFNQNFDFKINDHQSEIFLNASSVNFSYIESKSEFPFSPRLIGRTNRTSPECEFPNEQFLEEPAVCHKNSSKLPVKQLSGISGTNANQMNEHDFYYEPEEATAFNKTESFCNHTQMQTEQTGMNDTEDVECNTSERNEQDDNNRKQHAAEINSHSLIMDSNLSSSLIRRSNERVSLGITKPTNVDSGRRMTELHDIIEDNSERAKPASTYTRLPTPRYQSMPSREEVLNSNKGSLQVDNNDEISTFNYNRPDSVTSHQRVLSARMNERKPTISDDKDSNKNFLRKKPEPGGQKIHAPENENEQNISSSKTGNNQSINHSIRNNTPTYQGSHSQPHQDNKATPRKVALSSDTHNTTERKKLGRKIPSQPQQQPMGNSPPTKGYEYFEIPPPRPIKKTASEERNLNLEQRKNQLTDKKQASSPKQANNVDNFLPIESRFSKISQIPKRIPSPPKNMETRETFSYTLQKKEKEEESEFRNNNEDNDRKGYDNMESTTWDYQKDQNEIDNSLEKCLHWNTRISETVVMSEFNDYSQNKTSDTGKTTVVPKKSHIPVAKKDQGKSQSNQGKSTSAGADKNTTLLLTKTYKVPPGQSSYEKRKMYDTRIRKNVKRRSLSESNGKAKMLPLIYEVRYCNVYNQCLPQTFDSVALGGSRSDHDLSILSSNFDANDFKRSIESLTTVPSCFLKENKYKREEPCLSTEPSCLLKESKYGPIMQKEEDLSTEPSCLIKESLMYDLACKNYLPNKDNQNYDETCSNYSSKSERIKELIKENLLYVKYPPQNRKSKPSYETRKRKKKERSIGTKTQEKTTPKPKITLRCSKKSSKENGKRLRIVAKLNDNDNEVQNEPSENQDDDCPQCQNLTKLSIDKVNENEFRVSFEQQKSTPVNNESFDEKSSACLSVGNEFPNDRDSLDTSVSSKTTVINCASCSSVTSQESKETVKEREVFITSADDSGYLTKGAEINHSETTINSTNDGKACCSNIFKGFSSKNSDKKSATSKYKDADETSRWNQKDLVKLRIQLLFPHVYDDFELLEAAQNTDLIKYYVESENNKLKKAIDSISQKEAMSTKSRSVMSLPSVKMIPEEPNESIINGDLTSEYSSISQVGGFYNYQKFIAQNNACYSANVLSKLNKDEVGGDCSDILKDNVLSETGSVTSYDLPTARSATMMKKSVVELFKLRPSSAKKSSSSMFSDNDTLVEGNEEETVSMRMNLSDEEFFNNFHQIMAIECQKFAKKVRDQTKANEHAENDLEYEEIPLDCLLKNKNLNNDSSEDCLEPEFQLASDEICNKENDSNESTKKESAESFKSVTCIKENTVKPKKSNSKWQNLLKKKSSPASNSKPNLDFYPEERMSILDMIQTVQASNISQDSLNCSSKDKVLNVISSGEVTKQSEKQFFDNLLAFYDKESEFIKKLMRDDEFFSSLIEQIRNCDDTTQLIFMKDIQKRVKKEKKRGIFSRFFRWKEKKSTETLFENPSIGKSLEFAKSLSNESTSMARESCYSFYKDLEDLESMNELKHPNSEHLQQLAYKAKCHLEPMVKATISNRHISDKIKLAGFLKMLDMVAKGDFTFLSNGDDKTLEEKLRDHVAQMFEKVYLIANREVVQKNSFLDNDKIQLLKMLVTKYHMGVETHINILSIYIGRGLIETKAQLEDAIIFLMGQDSQDINLEQFEKNCGISSG